MSRFLTLAIAICLVFNISFANAKKGTKSFKVAFYNCENYYDTINDPTIDDEEFLPGAASNWNSTRFNQKKQHLAQVIHEIDPDAIGLSEIENKAVLDELVLVSAIKSANYGIVHYNSPDKRGIDVGFLYKKNSMHVNSSKVYGIRFPFDTVTRTRDILVVEATLNHNNAKAFFIVNHFPSRRGGAAESEMKRVFVGQQLKAIADSLERLYPTAAVIAMGDFNDEPSDKSMTQLLMNASNQGFVNPFAEIQAKGDGSIYFNNQWDLFDQILYAPCAQNASNPISYIANSAMIFKPTYVLEPEGKYKGAPLRTYVGKKYLGGYSDHMAVFASFNLKK